MTDCETAISNVENFRTSLNSETYNGYNKQRRKKQKHKLAEAKNISETNIMESNKTLNSIVQHESIANKKLALSKKENSRKRKVNDCEMVELATVEKSDNNVSSKKLHKKKRKHETNNGENVFDGTILEMAVQDLENNASIEISKELNRHRKKHKHKSHGEIEDLCNYKSKESGKAENNKILDELFKRKKHKQTEFDSISGCLSTDLNEAELSQTSLTSEIFSGVHKQKSKKRNKLVPAESSQTTANMESYQISNNTVCNESVEKDIIKNSDSQNISKLSRKNNRQLETKVKNDLKKKYKSINDTNEFGCKIIEPDEDEKSDNDVNSNKLHKKKRKHKATNGENVSGSRIAETDLQELENDAYIEFSNGLRRQKRKKYKHKLIGDMENVLNYQELVTDESINDRNLDTLEVHNRKNKHKQIEVDKISDCKAAESNPIEINQNYLNSEDVNRFHKEKKKKHEMENISDCKTAESDVIEINQNDLNSENVDRLKKEKKKKHKHKIFDEIDTISDCKTGKPDAIEINQIDLSIENFNRVHKDKKKKHKHKLNIEIVSDFKTAESDVAEINQNVQSENGDSLKKKRKRKHKIYDEMGTISDCKTVELDVVEINQNDLSSENVNRSHEEKKKKHKLVDEMENIYDLNKFHQKKKKKHGHTFFSEMENICNDNIQESVTEEAEMSIVLDTSDVQKRNKCKSSHVDKTTDSDAIEINQNHLSDGHHKPKGKKHGHNSAEVENLPKTVIESNNTSNDVKYDEHIEGNREKGIGQNSVVNKSPRKNKKHEESIFEIQSHNLKKKEKNVCYKGPEEIFQNVEGEYMSFCPFIHDLSEEPVPFAVPLLHENEAVTSITEERRKYLEEEGVTIHTGKWTKAEDDILTRNFLQFGLQFRVNNPFQLLGINQSQKDKNIELFKKAKHFLVRLGKDLDNRSLRSIYMRARKLITPLKSSEKLNAGETADLKHAHEMMGNKWTRISEILSRSDDTCHTAFRWHKKEIKKGKWTPEEENNLIKALKTLSGSEDISASNLNNIEWEVVAKYVPTRNEFQCHKQWAEHLAWDTSVSEKKKWTKYHFGKLVYLLKEKFCVNSEEEIDWRELHKYFVDVAPSYIFLHKKWYYLKGRLPKGFDSTYSNCLAALKRMYEKEYEKCAYEKL